MSIYLAPCNHSYLSFTVALHCLYICNRCLHFRYTKKNISSWTVQEILQRKEWYITVLRRFNYTEVAYKGQQIFLSMYFCYISIFYLWTVDRWCVEAWELYKSKNKITIVLLIEKWLKKLKNIWNELERTVIISMEMLHRRHWSWLFKIHMVRKVKFLLCLKDKNIMQLIYKSSRKSLYNNVLGAKI